jgi:hypothetical protein
MFRAKNRSLVPPLLDYSVQISAELRGTLEVADIEHDPSFLGR